MGHPFGFGADWNALLPLTNFTGKRIVLIRTNTVVLDLKNYFSLPLERATTMRYEQGVATLQGISGEEIWSSKQSGFPPPPCEGLKSVWFDCFEDVLLGRRGSMAINHLIALILVRSPAI
jgi:hypothetical protein